MSAERLEPLDSVLFMRKTQAGEVCSRHSVLLTWEDGKQDCDVCRHGLGRLCMAGEPRTESRRAMTLREREQRRLQPRRKRPLLKRCEDCGTPFFYSCMRCSGALA